jgi:chromosome segregation ATPase
MDAGNTTNFRIVEEVETYNSYSAMQLDVNAILQYAKTGAASDAVVQAFREIGRRQNEIAGFQRTIDDLERERVRIREEQERIRANMNTIDRNSDLYRRYMGKFTEQETRIEAIATETQKAQESRDKAQAALNDFVSELSVE